MRVAYLGPAGTFSEDALRAAAGGAELEPAPMPTIHDAVLAVERGEADRALVPFENSIEGSVRPTLDALAFDAPGVTIVGEHDQPISNSLIARTSLQLERDRGGRLAPAGERSVRALPPRAAPRSGGPGGVEHRRGGARGRRAPGGPGRPSGRPAAAEIYDCVVLRYGVEDEPDNVTRFVWLAPAGTESKGEGGWRTTLIFAELGADHPGALVEALTEFSSRGGEPDPDRVAAAARGGLGRYMFFFDLEGRAAEPPVAEAIEALRAKAESVRVLGSYPLRTAGIPGTGEPDRSPLYNARSRWRPSLSPR